MENQFFKTVGKIEFEGKSSRNPLAFRFYDKSRKVAGKSMADHFKFACAYWHSFSNSGADPFGTDTKFFPWNNSKDPYRRAKDKMDAAIEFMDKLGLDYLCFHDFDLIDEAESLADSEKRLAYISDYALEKFKAHDKKVLWGTANLFSHPRYMNGAATNPDFRVVAHAAAQVKMALDTSIKLGAENYVFWGGREGYLSLLNTDVKKERDHLAIFLHLARDYGRKQGFKGWFLIEPKPMEPTKHQYDFDVATVLAFLREYDLMDDFKLNIEVNHATLASHSFAHELQLAADAGVLASIDANRGDYQNGWDTDQFPVDLYELTEAMLVILEAGGLRGGGVNFDAKTRRNSTDPEDLFYAHIASMDNFARALLIADHILHDSEYRSLRAQRYQSFSVGDGARFVKGELSLEELSLIARNQKNIPTTSGRQEYFENIINMYIE